MSATQVLGMFICPLVILAPPENVQHTETANSTLVSRNWQVGLGPTIFQGSHYLRPSASTPVCRRKVRIWSSCGTCALFLQVALNSQET